MNYHSLLIKQGFVHVPKVLTSGEVGKARENLLKIFSEKSSFEGDVNQHPNFGNVFSDPFSRYKELRWVLFSPKVTEALKNTLGDDFVILPESAIHDSGFGGWHKDTTSQEIAGETFHLGEDFLMVQVGIYLQDNTKEYGGGLEVIPFSHRKRDRYANKVKPTIGEKLRNRLYKMKVASNPNEILTVASKAGDMVIFNLRLDHKASHPSVKPIPPANRKLAIFMVCSVNNKYPSQYLSYLKSRPDYVYLKNHQYPAELLAEARKNSINLMEA